MSGSYDPTDGWAPAEVWVAGWIVIGVAVGFLAGVVGFVCRRWRLVRR